MSPCTRCGVTGLRPTFGRVSRFGAMALAWSMDKIGPIARRFVVQPVLVATGCHGLKRHAQAREQLAAIGGRGGQDQAGGGGGAHGVLRGARCSLKNKDLSANSF